MQSPSLFPYTEERRGVTFVIQNRMILVSLRRGLDNRAGEVLSRARFPCLRICVLNSLKFRGASFLSRDEPIRAFDEESLVELHRVSTSPASSSSTGNGVRKRRCNWK